MKNEEFQVQHNEHTLHFEGVELVKAFFKPEGTEGPSIEIPCKGNSYKDGDSEKRVEITVEHNEHDRTAVIKADELEIEELDFVRDGSDTLSETSYSLRTKN